MTPIYGRPVPNDPRQKAEAVQRQNERDKTRDRVRQIVAQRWRTNGQRCELCDTPVSAMEVAHVLGKGGRRANVPEKWASTPMLCLALCCTRSYLDRIGCHEKLDRHLEASLEASAYYICRERLAEFLNGKVKLPKYLLFGVRFVKEAVYEMIRRAEEAHVAPW